MLQKMFFSLFCKGRAIFENILWHQKKKLCLKNEFFVSLSKLRVFGNTFLLLKRSVAGVVINWKIRKTLLKGFEPKRWKMFFLYFSKPRVFSKKFAFARIIGVINSKIKKKSSGYTFSVKTIKVRKKFFFHIF